MKIRPNAKPIPPFGSEISNVAKKGKKNTKTPLDQAGDMAKTAADLTKSKTSRLGKLMQGGGEAAGAVAGGVAGAAAGVAEGATGAADGTAMQAMQTVLSTAGSAVRQGLSGITSQVDRFQNIVQRHSELGYLTRLGGQNNDENDDEIKKAALGLRELNAGAGGGSPALSQLMDRVKDLNHDSPPSEWAEQFQGAGELMEQTGKELAELNTQFVFELQKAAAEVTQAETASSEVFTKFSDSAESIIGNI